MTLETALKDSKGRVRIGGKLAEVLSFPFERDGKRLVSVWLSGAMGHQPMPADTPCEVAE